jgi:hypothetical protein
LGSRLSPDFGFLLLSSKFTAFSVASFASFCVSEAARALECVGGSVTSGLASLARKKARGLPPPPTPTIHIYDWISGSISGAWRRFVAGSRGGCGNKITRLGLACDHYSKTDCF